MKYLWNYNSMYLWICQAETLNVIGRRLDLQF